MIKLVPTMDENNILAAKDFEENSKFLEKIMDALYFFAEVVKDGDVLIGATAFWEAVIGLNGLEDMTDKKVYVFSDLSWEKFQALHPKYKLPSNIKLVTDKNIDEVIAKYRKNETKDLYVWGGVNTFRRTVIYADQIWVIRVHQNRKEGYKFDQNVLDHFDLISVDDNHEGKFQLEIYQKT